MYTAKTCIAFEGYSGNSTLAMSAAGLEEIDNHTMPLLCKECVRRQASVDSFQMGRPKNSVGIRS